MSNTSPSVFILGANGRFGHHVALAFAQAGWQVKAQIRPGKTLNPELVKVENIHSVPLNLEDAPAAATAADGCQIIINGLNPSYGQWEADVPKLTACTLQLARTTGATILLPGNVYTYGATMPDLLTPSTPQRPSTRLGEIRRDMEQKYQKASHEGVQTIILRIGDFLQSQSTGNWFDTHMIAGLAKSKFAYPGDPDIPHAFGYLPDVGRAAVALADIRQDLPAFADIPFAGTTLTGNQLRHLIENELDRSLTPQSIPWTIIRLMAVFNKDMRGILAMRYLWNTPHRLSGDEMARLLPHFNPTPIQQIIKDCVARYKADIGQPKPASHQTLAIGN